MQPLKITIPSELKDLNTYIKALNSSRYGGNKIKHEDTEFVFYTLRKLKLAQIKNPVYMDFVWFTKDLKKDPDNICFSKKSILDGMVLAHLLPNDTRKWILGFKDDFAVDKLKPRVEITLWN